MKLMATMKLESKNDRREKAGEDLGDLACDLKFSGYLNQNQIKSLFRVPGAFECAAQALWAKDTGAAVPGIGTLVLDEEIADCTINLGVDEDLIRIRGCKLNKVHIKPDSAHSADVKLRIQCYPSAGQFDGLAALLGTQVPVFVDATDLLSEAA